MTVEMIHGETELLVRELSHGLRACLLREKYLVVVGIDSGETYLIDRGVGDHLLTVEAGVMVEKI